VPITRQDTLLTDDLIAKYTRAGYWDTTTFSDVLRRNASATPDREAFVDARTRITWRELWEISGRIADGLRARGIAAGDVVAVQLPNRVEFVYLLAAITRLGAVLCQYPPDYRAREVEFILGFSDARAVVVPQRWKSFDFTPMIDEMRSQLPGLQLTVVVEDDRYPQVTSPGWTRLADLAADSHSPSTPDFPRRDANDVMRIAFTSGTTGDPKAVMHTSNTTIFTNRLQNEAWGITPASRILVLLPVGLNVGLFAIIQTSLAAATAVLMEQFDAGRALALIQSEQITTFFAAPTALIALLNHPTLAECDLSSLELVQTGGASTPVQVLREANDRSSTSTACLSPGGRAVPRKQSHLMSGPAPSGGRIRGFRCASWIRRAMTSPTARKGRSPRPVRP
jgi:acyl-CoA synthetase (AMP-forming)/AMP-acid ligase II